MNIKKWFSSTVSLAILACVNAQPATVPVFTSGNDGYANFRIPAIIKAQNGDLLAFSEGRVAHAGDFGDIDIVMKRSKDGGSTWGTLQKVADYGNLQAGNPAPVLDQYDPQYTSGRIFLFYNTGDNHEGEVRKGHGLREVWYKTSMDQGNTWSDPVNITLQVHRPKQPQLNSTYTFDEDWRSYANTPGHATQFDHGPLKGRLYVAANHSAGAPQEGFKDYQAHGYYTDDHGNSFKLSESVPALGSNESMASQLMGDTLLMNSRDQQGAIRRRIISISSDGGASWDTTFHDNQLPDPVNQGSLLAFNDQNGKRLLAFCNTADTIHRDNLTLRISKDGGKTWFFNRQVAKGKAGYEGAYAAYSDIVVVSGNRLGILFEREDYTQIVFTTVKWH